MPRTNSGVRVHREEAEEAQEAEEAEVVVPVPLVERSTRIFGRNDAPPTGVVDGASLVGASGCVS